MRRFSRQISRIGIAAGIACALLLPTLTAADPPRGWVIERAGARLWVVSEDRPAAITPALLQNLFDLLLAHIAQDAASPFADLPADAPVLVRFVPAEAGEARFPEGTEGFAALTGPAHWRCGPAFADDQRRICEVWVGAAALGSTAVLLAVSRIQEDPGLTVGYALHELAHACGAVDGVRCPAHADYNPARRLPPDHQDAYWWFGVTGFFVLRPGGIAWAALNGWCERSDEPALCTVLWALLADCTRSP